MSIDESKDLPVELSHDDPGRTVSVTGIQLDAYRVYRNQEQGGADAPASSPSEFSIRDILYTLFRHKWKIVSIWMACAVSAIAFVATSQDFYASEAKILIRNDKARVIVDPTATTGSYYQAKGDAGLGGDSPIRTGMAVLQSNDVAGKVVDKLGAQAILDPLAYSAGGSNGIPSSTSPTTTSQAKSFARKAKSAGMRVLNLVNPPLSPKDQAVRGILAGVTVEPTMGGSSVLLIKYVSESPNTAQDVLKELVDSYSQTYADLMKPQVKEFKFDKDAKELRAQIEQKETEIATFQKENNITSLVNELDSIKVQYDDFDTQFKASQRRVTTLKATLATLKKQLQDRADKVQRNPRKAEAKSDPAIERARDRRMELTLKRIELLKRFKPNSREITEIDGEIAKIDELLNNHKTQTPDEEIIEADPGRMGLQDKYDDLQRELEAETANLNALSTDRDKAKTKLDQTRKLQPDLDKLQKDLAALHEKLKPLEKTTINEDPDATGISVVQGASVPYTTVRTIKKKLALMAFGVFGGLVGGILIAFALDFMDHSLKTTEEVEKMLGLPVLVALPRIRNAKPLPQKEVA